MLKFNHSGIKCVDVDASFKYYTEVIGLEKLFEVEILGKRCIFVGKDAFQLELEEIKVAPQMPAGPPEVGLSHLAFESDDIEKDAEELTARGAEFLIPPFQIRPTRKTAFIKAPDNVMIQLVEDKEEE